MPPQPCIEVKNGKPVGNWDDANIGRGEPSDQQNENSPTNTEGDDVVVEVEHEVYYDAEEEFYEVCNEVEEEVYEVDDEVCNEVEEEEYEVQDEVCTEVEEEEYKVHDEVCTEVKEEEYKVHDEVCNEEEEEENEVEEEYEVEEEEYDDEEEYEVEEEEYDDEEEYEVEDEVYEVHDEVFDEDYNEVVNIPTLDFAGWQFHGLDAADVVLYYTDTRELQTLTQLLEQVSLNANIQADESVSSGVDSSWTNTPTSFTFTDSRNRVIQFGPSGTIGEINHEVEGKTLTFRGDTLLIDDKEVPGVDATKRPLLIEWGDGVLKIKGVINTEFGEIEGTGFYSC